MKVSKVIGIFLLCWFIVSCSITSSDIRPPQKVVERDVYIKCQVPEVPKARFNMTNETSYPYKLKSVLDYLFDLKKENELLRKAIKACSE